MTKNIGLSSTFISKITQVQRLSLNASAKRTAKEIYLSKSRYIPGSCLAVKVWHKFHTGAIKDERGNNNALHLIQSNNSNFGETLKRSLGKQSANQQNLSSLQARFALSYLLSYKGRIKVRVCLW